MEARLCPECGNEIFGRSDKKFCNDACRNAHNNRLNSDNTNYVRNVNNILRKNRRILEMLNTEGKTKVHRDKMVLQGFDFNFFTSAYQNKAGDEYRFCYEQGFLPLKDDFYLLVVRTMD